MNMKSIHNSERGTSLVVLLLAVVVIVVIGAVAYRVKSNTLSSPTSSRSAVVSPPKAIKSKADLRIANQALQTAPIGSGVDPSQLDSSVKSLL